MGEPVGAIFVKICAVLVGVLIIVAAFLLLTSQTYGAGTDPGYSASNNPNVIAGSFSQAAHSFGAAAQSTSHKVSNNARSLARSTATGVTSSVRTVGRVVGGSAAFVGRNTIGGLAFVGRNVVGGIVFVGHGVGDSLLAIGHTLGHIGGFITHVTGVSALIRPTNYRPAPAINTDLAAVLARSNAQAQLAAYNKQKSADLVTAQLAANRSLDGTVVAGDPTHGGYPTKWDSPTRQDSLVDNWGMYNRECVSYTAWKVYQTYGSMPYWGGVGNANQWPGDARTAGVPTGSTPKVHSVAISLHGYYGHAMWVEAVSGNMIYVSQYNYDLAGHYSEMWVNGSSFTYIYFK